MCIELICDECHNPFRIGGPGYQPRKPAEHGIGFLCRDCSWKRPDYTVTPEWDKAHTVALFLEEFHSGYEQPKPEAPSIPKLIAKLAFRITLVIALAIGVLAVIS